MKLGERQILTMVKSVDFGIYLADEDNAEERVLLPIKQVPQGIQSGEQLEVFLYKDSQDRLIATTNQPKLVIGEFALLSVASVSEIGAFLDWGLEKDLFLPFKEQLYKVQAGDEILVRLYIDKTMRLCGTMKGIYELLSQDSPYKKDDMVKGRVYELSRNFGAFIAVDDKYSALIPAHEDHSSFHVGEVIESRVVEVKPDGKLTLTMRDKSYLQMDQDAQKVMELIESYNGVLPFNDKAPADTIMEETGLSKNAFKRAVGKLYKERKIQLKDAEIRKI
ncbi:MAG: S1-like domain-containing RNA-binding protein [Lachnospiraceae bacterium]